MIERRLYIISGRWISYVFIKPIRPKLDSTFENNRFNMLKVPPSIFFTNYFNISRK